MASGEIRAIELPVRVICGFLPGVNSNGQMIGTSY